MVARIKQLMILVRNRAKELVYLERFDADEVAKLPTTDVSADDKGKKKPNWKDQTSARTRADKGKPGERFEISVWISLKAGVFANCARDVLPREDGDASDHDLGGIKVPVSIVRHDQWHARIPEEAPVQGNPRIEGFTPEVKSLDDFKKTEFYKYWRGMAPWPDDRLLLWRD